MLGLQQLRKHFTIPEFPGRCCAACGMGSVAVRVGRCAYLGMGYQSAARTGDYMLVTDRLLLLLLLSSSRSSDSELVPFSVCFHVIICSGHQTLRASLCRHLCLCIAVRGFCG